MYLFTHKLIFCRQGSGRQEFVTCHQWRQGTCYMSVRNTSIVIDSSICPLTLKVPPKKLQRMTFANFVPAFINQIKHDISCESSASRWFRWNIKAYFPWNRSFSAALVIGPINIFGLLDFGSSYWLKLSVKYISYKNCCKSLKTLKKCLTL